MTYVLLALAAAAIAVAGTALLARQQARRDLSGLATALGEPVAGDAPTERMRRHVDQLATRVRHERDASRRAERRLDLALSSMTQGAVISDEKGTIDLQVAVQLAVVARFYERIGDHAVNIGERVRFLVTGWVHERDGAARYSERQAASDLE